MELIRKLEKLTAATSKITAEPARSQTSGVEKEGENYDKRISSTERGRQSAEQK